jgi:predicted dehydrogenase
MSVKIGFVGCGGIANAHMKNLAQMENAELVAFCDIVGEKAQAAADEYGGQAFTDHREMYEQAEMDAVYVCLPPFAHTDQEVLAAQAGLSLFVEKPIAISMEKAREIEAAIADADIIDCVGYHFRYHDTTAWAKEALGDQTIAIVLGYWMGGFPQVAWWRVMDESGGQILEQTTHIIDLARYFAGEVERVSAEMALRVMHDVENISITDVGTVNLRFESGAIGNITNSCIPPGMMGSGLNVAGEDTVCLITQDTLKIKTADGVEEKSWEWIAPHWRESEVFVKAVETGDASEILSPYSDAVKSLAVSIAANESAETGQPVAIADV